MNKTSEDPLKKFMKAKYEEIAVEEYITVSDGSELRILKSKASEESNGYTLLLLAGWGTIVIGWDEVLMEASKDFDIVYLESREKGSSKLTRGIKHDLDRLSSDIQEVIELLNLTEDKLISFGSCFGALLIAHGLAECKFDSYMTVLAGPVLRLEIPTGFLRYLIPIGPAFILDPIKPMVNRWIRKKKSENEEQAAKYIRVLEEAEAKKWKNVAKRVAIKKHLNTYSRVKNKVLIVDEEEDPMHNTENTKLILSKMENAMYVNMKTNKNTHSKPMVDLIREYIPKFKK
ncbi:MAG: hypothetical protein H7641_03800 [Candidatus Heimdallarchaeota archaeon]|nr:hypothetical protein [Candidatus Heimdallarchaeota archaeon]MCK4876687.1 hypothetical protein [Candidatus Heimdallarchaeota archaeon]